MQLVDVTRRPPDTRKYSVHSSEANELPLPRCHMGIEIEAEGFYNGYPEPLGWTCKEDGSLRNYGKEFVTEPVFGDDLIDSLTSIEEALNDPTYRPEYNSRTGLHVHIDMRDVPSTDILHKFLLTYVILEDLLFAYCGNNRDNNIYCLPMRKALCPLFEIISAYHVNKPMSYEELINRYNKYTPMNINTMSTFGTAEFRLHYGTHDKDTIIKWIKIVQSIKKFAMETSLTARTIVNKYVRSRQAFVREVLPLDFVEPYINSDTCNNGTVVRALMLSNHNKTTKLRDKAIERKNKYANYSSKMFNNIVTKICDSCNTSRETESTSDTIDANSVATDVSNIMSCPAFGAIMDNLLDIRLNNDRPITSHSLMSYIERNYSYPPNVTHGLALICASMTDWQPGQNMDATRIVDWGLLPRLRNKVSLLLLMDPSWISYIGYDFINIPT